MNNPENTLSEIKKKVEGKEKEQVLLVTQNTHSLVSYFRPPTHKGPFDDMTITTKFFKLGIFDNVSFPEEAIIFNMDNYVERDSGHNNYWKRTEGNINFHPYSLWEENASLHIGNEVNEFFKDERNLRGRFSLVDESYLDNMEYKKNPDLSYVRALHLLGAEAPRDLDELYIKSCLEKAISLYGTINDIERKSGALEKRIQAISKIPEKGGVFIENGAIGLVEDSDDAFWYTLGDREKVKENRNEISRCLLDGLTAGLHEYDLNFRLQPGIMVDVKEYVLGLCRNYGVDIPKELCMSEKQAIK